MIYIPIWEFSLGGLKRLQAFLKGEVMVFTQEPMNLIILLKRLICWCDDTGLKDHLIHCMCVYIYIYVINLCGERSCGEARSVGWGLLSSQAHGFVLYIYPQCDESRDCLNIVARMPN